MINTVKDLEANLNKIHSKIFEEIKQEHPLIFTDILESKEGVEEIYKILHDLTIAQNSDEVDDCLIRLNVNLWHTRIHLCRLNHSIKKPLKKRGLF